MQSNPVYLKLTISKKKSFWPQKEWAASSDEDSWKCSRKKKGGVTR